MRGEVVGRVERRRRWSDGEKLAVVMASLEPDAVVATVARRFDVTRQQIYDWRRAARQGDLGLPGGVVGFVEVVAAPPAHGAAVETQSRQTVTARLLPPAPADAAPVNCVVIDVITDVVCGAGGYAGWDDARVRASATLDG